MSLNLAPDIEIAVQKYAEREGISIHELLARTFPVLPSNLTSVPSDPVNTVQELLRQWQRDYGLPIRPDGKTHTSAAELFAQWDAEDARRLPEEVKADQRLWENLERTPQSVSL
jgi:hypothetical protein